MSLEEDHKKTSYGGGGCIPSPGNLIKRIMQVPLDYDLATPHDLKSKLESTRWMQWNRNADFPRESLEYVEGHGRVPVFDLLRIRVTRWATTRYVGAALAGAESESDANEAAKPIPSMTPKTAVNLAGRRASGNGLAEEATSSATDGETLGKGGGNLDSKAKG